MYIKHTDPYGNELGLYRSIKEASAKIEASPTLLSILFKHKLPLSDGSTITRAVGANQDRRAVRERIRKALAEYSNIGTHYKYLARKYNIDIHVMRRAVIRHEKESRLHLAYAEWLASGGSVSSIAEQFDVSAWSLGVRIRKGLQS